MTAWRLTDGRNPADGPDDFPSVLVASELELRRELDRLRQLDPGIVSLTSPAGQSLQIGIGGPFAGLRWYPGPKSSEGSRDLLADREYIPKRVDFLAEGDTISFWPEHLMPTDQAAEIVVYFFNHQRIPEWVGWKEWDPGRNRWNVKQASSVPSL